MIMEEDKKQEDDGKEIEKSEKDLQDLREAGIEISKEDYDNLGDTIEQQLDLDNTEVDNVEKDLDKTVEKKEELEDIEEMDIERTEEEKEERRRRLEQERILESYIASDIESDESILTLHGQRWF